MPDKLAAEAEGILALGAVAAEAAGALYVYAEGLGKPPDVEAAGDTWRAQSDHIGRFIEEAYITVEYAQAKARTLYAACKSWAAEARRTPRISEKVFALRIVEKKSSPKKHTRVGNVYQGIGLRAERDSEGEKLGEEGMKDGVSRNPDIAG